MDSLPEDAVWIGPVSNREFPANREINREFCKIPVFPAILVSS